MPTRDDASDNGKNANDKTSPARMNDVPRDSLRDAFSAFRDEVICNPQDATPVFLLETAAELIDMANIGLVSRATKRSADQIARVQALLDDMIQDADASQITNDRPRP